MIIIIEGPDGSGKTYIATELAKRRKIPLERIYDVNESNRLDTSLNSVHETKETTSLLEKSSVIFDRHYPSEFVYGVTLRGRDLLSVRESDVLLTHVPHLIVICAKELSDPLHREQYLKFTRWSKANCMLLDTTDEKLEAQLESIEQRIKVFLDGMLDKL